jgi:sugar phosphate isomerase/epimerase
MLIGTTSNYTLGQMGIEEGFALLRDIGFSCVDFGFQRWLCYEAITQLKPNSFFEESDEKLRTFFQPYKQAAQRYGVRIWQSHAPFPTYTKDKATNEAVELALRKCIMLSGYLDCRYLVIHPAFLDYHDKLSAREEWDLNIRLFGSLIPLLKEFRVMACMENIYTRYSRDLYDGVCCEMQTANRYIDTLNKMAGEKCFGFCLDTGHALLTRNDIYSAITELGDRLAVLHIHDNDGVSDLHMAPYMGKMDWERFLRALRDIGYDGCISYEADSPMGYFGMAAMKEYLQFLRAIGELFSQKLSE